ncbi:MAG: FliA/WhiG subfamily polymerase sigma-28 subunit [Frankiales bacterium]|nr:FliA/WhiG subfamily polymerase sigma-28 subunit [Frankiales bacterium]
MTENPTSAPTPAELIESNLPLVQHVLSGVAAHFPRHADRDEMMQAARLGLVEAAYRYDPERGVPFERWAALRIRGAILDSVRAVDFAPRALRSALRDAELAQQELERELGRTPTPAEKAERLHISRSQLADLEARAHRALVLSLDAPAGTDDESSSIAGHLAAPGTDPADLLVDREQVRLLHESVDLLPSRLRAVVVGYFLEGEASATIAARLGVTESRVSQLRSEAITLLRSILRGQDDEMPVSAASGMPARALGSRVRTAAVA